MSLGNPNKLGGAPVKTPVPVGAPRSGRRSGRRSRGRDQESGWRDSDGRGGRGGLCPSRSARRGMAKRRDVAPPEIVRLIWRTSRSWMPRAILLLASPGTRGYGSECRGRGTGTAAHSARNVEGRESGCEDTSLKVGGRENSGREDTRRKVEGREKWGRGEWGVCIGKAIGSGSGGGAPAPMRPPVRFPRWFWPCSHCSPQPARLPVPPSWIPSPRPRLHGSPRRVR
jgi:hypothetical protein